MPKRKTKKKPTRPRKSSKARSAKLPKDAVTLIVQLRPRDGQEMLLEAELRALVGPTRKEDGCLTYDLHRSAEGPTAFLLDEVWASRELIRATPIRRTSCAGTPARTPSSLRATSRTGSKLFDAATEAGV